MQSAASPLIELVSSCGVYAICQASSFLPSNNQARRPGLIWWKDANCEDAVSLGVAHQTASLWAVSPRGATFLYPIVMPQDMIIV